MITIGDLFLAVLLLGPKPKWYRPLLLHRWRKGMERIRQAAAALHMQEQLKAVAVQGAALSKAQDQWGMARVEDGEVN